MSKCKYINTCPAATGWCNNMEPSLECLSMVINHYDRVNRKKNGLLIVKMNAFCKPDDFNKMQKGFVKQAEDGVVVIPNFCTAEYVPPDVIVKMEE